MRYTVDLTTNRDFLQIFGTTESLAPMEVPLAFQVRGGSEVLLALASALDEVHERIHSVDAQFHDSVEARNDFERGFIVFRPGEVPVTCMVHRRDVVLMLGRRQVGSGPIALEPLRAAVNAVRKRSPKR